MNSIIELKLSMTMTMYEVIKECVYSMSNIAFHAIEIANVVMIADAISKEVR